MAKVLRLHEYTGNDGIRLGDVIVPEPQTGEVRISVDAFSLNYVDFDLFENNYVFTIDLPARFGDECAGVIDAVGEGVTDCQTGDRVNTLPGMGEGFGVDGEFAIVPPIFAAKYPDNRSPEEAFCVLVAYLTAYYSFMNLAREAS